MTLKRALTVLVLTALAALSGCGDSAGRRDLDASVDPGLGPVTYVVTSVTHHSLPRQLVKGTEIRIRFADAEATLTAGCNTMSGGYQLEESRLTLEHLTSTDMGCDPARTAQDTWLAGLFARTVQLTTGNEPTIVAGSTVLAMADREQVFPDKPLLGTRWKLDTLIDGGVVSSLPAGRSASMRIVGRDLRAQDGCNDGSGAVLIRNGIIGFSDVVFTTRPCPSSDQVAPSFGAFLAGAGTYEITENRLTITHDGRGLGFTAAD